MTLRFNRRAPAGQSYALLKTKRPCIRARSKNERLFSLRPITATLGPLLGEPVLLQHFFFCTRRKTIPVDSFSAAQIFLSEND